MPTDIELSRRLERTEASANADFVETHSKLEPDAGYEWIEVAGAYVMYDGVASPLTQTFGLGVFEDAKAEHFEKIETFYAAKGAPIFLEISPLADQSILAILKDRGYHPIELTSVMYRELHPDDDQMVSRNPELVARLIGEDEADAWAAVAAEGWASEYPELHEFIRDMGQITSRTKGSKPFLVELDGRPIAAGGFSIYDDICILAGAATIPWARNRGAQNALVAARLNYARDHGCSIAMMCALPGSQSQKNAERNGFRIAYTRIKWQKDLG